MKGLQRPHLILADAFGPFEVIRTNLNLLLLPTESRENACRRTQIRLGIGLHSIKKGVDFSLIERLAFGHVEHLLGSGSGILPHLRPASVIGQPLAMA